MEEVVVVKPIRNVDVCVMCGTCESFCPSSCITVSDDEDLWFNYKCCRGCNTCATVCPQEAIEMAMVT